MTVTTNTRPLQRSRPEDRPLPFAAPGVLEHWAESIDARMTTPRDGVRATAVHVGCLDFLISSVHVGTLPGIAVKLARLREQIDAGDHELVDENLATIIGSVAYMSRQTG